MFGPSGFHPRRADSTDWHNTPQPLSSQIRSLLWSTNYHPAHLRDLPQPVPSDLPRGAESVFTFEDAFEDLLAVSQGQTLPNIHDKLSQRRLLNQVFPRGEPSQFWIRRLDSQGLMPWLSGEHQDQAQRVPLRKQAPESKPQDWDRLHSELAQRREETWNAESSDQSKRRDEPRVTDLLELGVQIIKSHPELEKALRDIEGHILGEATRRTTQAREDIGQCDKAEQLMSDKAEGKYPNTFDALFDHVQSFQTHGASTWDAFKKSLDSGREMIENLTKDRSEEELHRDLDRVDAGLKKLFGEKAMQEMKAEHASQWARREEEAQGQTDNVEAHVKDSFGGIVFQEQARGIQTSISEQSEFRDGKWHTTKTWVTRDAKGNEIDRKSDYWVDTPGHAQDETKTEYERGYPADSGEVRKPGWFWK